ncbi:hypothetical protein SAMN05444008_10119 [Cnuella takakiae]|uniref:Uncharacterized protein n=1 Tax=Cnuella takakiae TaxID=1302690 RepID=A0A1M4S8L6_9BACT|nr:hypothetical protein SAMN05444008_10119 [Cnuella takakiae]
MKLYMRYFAIDTYSEFRARFTQSRFQHFIYCSEHSLNSAF